MLVNWGSPRGGPALSFNFTLGTIAAAVAATFTRATTKTITDWEGNVRTILSGEVPFNGLRRVRNLIPTNSDNLSAAPWVATNATIVGGVADPQGGNTAFTLTSTGASGRITANFTAIVGNAVLTSWYIRRRTGVGGIQMYNGTGSTAPSITAAVTAGWQRITPTVATADNAVATIGVLLGVIGDAVDIWFPQAEDVTGQSNQNPSERLSVGVLASPFQGANVDGVMYYPWQNGNTVAANVVTAGTGAALPNGATWPAGYRPEIQSTNLVLQSENFGTTWVVVGTPTRTPANVNVGSLNLDLLNDPDAGTLDGYTQVVTFTGDGVKAISVYVKKGTATSSVVRVRDTTGAADRLLMAITWTGNVPTATMTTGTLIGAFQVAGNVYRIEMLTTAVTAASTNQIEVYPATDAALSVAATGNINVGGVQAENNTAFCTSYIATTTVTVTRNKEQMQVTSLGAWFNSSAGAMVARYVAPNRAVGNFSLGAFSDGSATNRITLYVANNVADELVEAAGVVSSNVNGGVVANATACGEAHAWSTNDTALYLNGAQVGTDNTVTIPSVTTLDIGADGGNTIQFCGILQRLDYYAFRVANADLQRLTT